MKTYETSMNSRFYKSRKSADPNGAIGVWKLITIHTNHNPLTIPTIIKTTIPTNNPYNYQNNGPYKQSLQSLQNKQNKQNTNKQKSEKIKRIPRIWVLYIFHVISSRMIEYDKIICRPQRGICILDSKQYIRTTILRQSIHV